MLIFALPPLALFFGKIGKLLYLYRRRVGTSAFDTLAAAIAGLSLSHTIAKAVVWGFITKDIPFFRTPKLASPNGILVALANAREEVILMLLLWGSAFGIQWVQPEPSPDVTLWSFVLMVQSLPYVAALIMSLISAMHRPSAESSAPVSATTPSA